MTPGAQTRRGLTIAELTLVLVGALLRALFIGHYDPKLGYDWVSHSTYYSFVAEHHRLPPVTLVTTAYHPPLFYWLAGFLQRHGVSEFGLQKISAVLGVASLLLVWVGLRRYLPSHPMARLLALALAAVLPVSLHLDGMVSNEPLNRFLGTLALLLGAYSFEAGAPRPVLRSLATAMVLSLGVLAKVSALALVATVGLTAALAALRPGGLRQRALRLVPAILPVCFAVMVSAPLSLRAHRDTQHWFASGFDAVPWGRAWVAQIANKPYLARRSADAVYGLGGGKLLVEPWVRLHDKPDGHFLPLLLVSTYSDYYDYRFVDDAPSPGSVATPHGVLSPRTQRLMRASVCGGLLLALALLAAFPPSLLRVLRQRDDSRTLLLLAPIVATLGQLHFWILFPFDNQGPVKGLYLLFASAPLYALVGLSFEHLARRPPLRPLAAPLLLALIAVATYTVTAAYPR